MSPNNGWSYDLFTTGVKNVDCGAAWCLKKPSFLHGFACNQQFCTQSRLNPELVNCLQSSCDFLCRVLLCKRDFLSKAS